MASASGYNHHRFSRALLKKSRKWDASLTVEFHSNNWKFQHSVGLGVKAHPAMLFTYDGPMRPFLMALRSQTIPAALIPFLYDIQPPVQFVDGCVVVEVHDKRRTPETMTRIVMRPAPLALTQTIDCMMERRGISAEDERFSQEIEARILSGTSAPLYIGTSLLATRNAVLAMGLTAPTPANLSANGEPRSTTSNPSSSSSSDFERMRRLLRAGDTSRSSSSGGMGAPFQPTWSVLRAKARAEEIEKEKARERAEGHAAAMAAVTQGQGQGQGYPGPGNGNGESASGAGGEKKKTKKKRQAEEDAAGGEVKKPKKKKTAGTAIAPSTGTGSGGDTKVKIEPAGPGNAGAQGDKPKKPKKKKPAAE